MANVYPGYPAIHPTNAPVAGSSGVLLESVSSIVGNASATLTLGGTITATDTITVTINGHPVVYTVVAGDTSLTVLAGHVAAAITSDGTDSAIVSATSSSPAIAITALSPGAAGMYSISASVGGTSHTETATVSSSELDLANNYVIPSSTFSWMHNGMPQTYYSGYPYQVESGTKTQMRSAGLIY